MTGSRRRSRLLVGVLLAFATLVAYAPRVDHYRDWLGERPKRFAGDVVTSNLDAYHWLRMAREIRAGEWDPAELDPLRRHPDGMVRGESRWMSRAIAFAARWTDGDVYRAALWIALASSCLFVIPLVLYAASVGWPAAGVLGGLVGAASLAVVGRVAAHRIDTDGVNLFAFWWICLLLALLRSDRGLARPIAVTLGAGVSVAFFVAWYRRPGLYVVFAATFALCLLARRFPLRRMALLGAVFLVVANPFALDERLFVRAKHYATLTFEPRGVAPVAEANREAADARSGWSPLERTSFVVEEQRRFALRVALKRVLEPAWLAALGLIAFAGWALWQWRLAAALLPLAGLGAMGLVTSSRFLMYLAPLAGFGLGVLLSIAVRAATRRTPFAGHAESVACALAFAAFAAMLPGTAYDWRPPAMVSRDEVAGLQRCARDLPEDAVVWHSWGYGYLVQDVMGAATFTDGGHPHPVIDHLLVKALTDPDPQVLERTIAYLDRHPQSEVEAAFREDYPSAYQRLLEGPAEMSRPAYVLFTPRSMRDFGSYARRGQWDFETGQPGSQKIRRMRCRRSEPGVLRCRSRIDRPFLIDTKLGTVEPTDGGAAGRTLVARRLRIREGFVERERRYPHRSGVVMEVVLAPSGGDLQVYLMQRPAFASNLNQLYVLGRPDARYLELVCDDFPHARLYRVGGTQPAPSGVGPPG